MMNQSRAVPRCLSSTFRGGNASNIQRRFFQKQSKPPGTQTAVANRGSQNGRNAALILSVTVGACYLLYPSHVYAESASKSAGTIKFEDSRTKPISKEENRDLISSQHLQVKKSWENPGVYAWSVQDFIQTRVLILLQDSMIHGLFCSWD